MTCTSQLARCGTSSVHASRESVLGRALGVQRGGGSAATLRTDGIHERPDGDAHQQRQENRRQRLEDHGDKRHRDSDHQENRVTRGQVWSEPSPNVPVIAGETHDKGRADDEYAGQNTAGERRAE